MAVNHSMHLVPAHMCAFPVWPSAGWCYILTNASVPWEHHIVMICYYYICVVVIQSTTPTSVLSLQSPCSVQNNDGMQKHIAVVWVVSVIDKISHTYVYPCTRVTPCIRDWAIIYTLPPAVFAKVTSSKLLRTHISEQHSLSFVQHISQLALVLPALHCCILLLY